MSGTISPHCSWASLLSRLPVLSAHSFTNNGRLPFLNQRKGENGRWNYFMTNLHERMLPDVRIKPAIVRIPGGSASDRATAPVYVLLSSAISIALASYFRHTSNTWPHIKYILGFPTNMFHGFNACRTGKGTEIWKYFYVMPFVRATRELLSGFCRWLTFFSRARETSTFSLN